MCHSTASTGVPALQELDLWGRLTPLPNIGTGSGRARPEEPAGSPRGHLRASPALTPHSSSDPACSPFPHTTRAPFPVSCVGVGKVRG